MFGDLLVIAEFQWRRALYELKQERIAQERRTKEAKDRSEALDKEYELQKAIYEARCIDKVRH